MSDDQNEPCVETKMDTEQLILQLHGRAGTHPEESVDADSLIGFFQSFRPDGIKESRLFAGLELFNRNDSSDVVAEGLDDRLTQLFDVAGNHYRPGGGKDAYFVVRNPAPIDPELVERLARELLGNLAELATTVGDAETATVLESNPRIRVLEGLPPKHPRSDDEKTAFLRMMQEDVPSLVTRLDVSGIAKALRPAYYFIACDPLLRDHLMWPMYSQAAGMDDPFEPYFQLWKHGVKYRIFQEDQVDFYLPRVQ
ncbi:hypothetical protein LF1_19690 [Rubripirellula obstinata]|uniref:Uncharacterized protein n=1 Tax=Rubripirellula obstinata TaxID=406547 RepID=A0A5B1CE67_9BACT|nr:hypothetical protein [Rubripirellula obstinata]KAA1259437.1 hypothetical protein LF1_19690 [Rubripirellula obstinata]